MPHQPVAPPRLLPWTLTMRLGYWAYQGAAHLALPLFLWVIFRRARREPLYKAHVRHRFGLVPRGAEGCIWIFAASLGETRAVTPLIRALLERGHQVALSHSSPAGMEEARRQFPEQIAAGRVVQTYMPVDVWWAVRLALARLRPSLALVVEAEIWPAHIAGCVRAGVAVAKVNANLTEKALQRDRTRALGRLRLFFLQGLSLVLTKTSAHEDRYGRAGVPMARIVNVGELKFDMPLRDDLIEKGLQLRPYLAMGRAVWMIASSIEREEPALHAIIAALHDRLKSPPLVVWAPRSPQRFTAVAESLRHKGWRVERRSTLWGTNFSGPLPENLPPDLDVLVTDSLGEMDFSYALANIVFVGATLVDMGGHNVNEPLALERPVVTGPSVYGIPTPAEEAIAQGAMQVYPDEQALTDGLVDLFSDPAARAAFRARTKGLTLNHLGAAQRSADALAPLIRTDG